MGDSSKRDASVSLLMAEIVSLKDAVAELVSDGDVVALEGFTHLIPHAAGHELIRQRRRGLTLIRLTPDIVYDQMIGMGCASKLVFSWGGNPGVGLASPPARRGRARLAGAAGAGGAFACRYGCGVRCRRIELAVWGVARVCGHRPGEAHLGDHDRVSVYGRAARGGAGSSSGCRHRPCPARRPQGQCAAVGHQRRSEGDRARLGAVDRDGGGGGG